MTKIIIGLSGEMASGKSTVTEYLKKKYSAVSFRFSDTLRDVLKRIHQEETRENMQKLSTILRQNFGEDLLSKSLAKEVEKSEQNFIITEGIRRSTDIIYLKSVPGFHLIALDVEEKIRYERIIKRSENPDDKNKTWEQFQKEGQEESEQQIKLVAKEAEFVVNNNGNLDDLYRQIDEIIEKYKNTINS